MVLIIFILICIYTYSDGIVSSHCVHRSYFCDGIINCADGSDEMTSGPGLKCRVSKINKKGENSKHIKII